MSTYFPRQGAWDRREPASVGMNPETLREAISFAKNNDSHYPNTVDAQQRQERNAERMQRNAWKNGGHGDEHEYHETIGPLPSGKRGGPTGLVIKDGYIVGKWGDIQKVDMANSITKSCLATLAGLAVADGLISDVHEPVGEIIRSGEFDYGQNGEITWHHLLQQTSEWAGTLFGKPDMADRRAGRERELEAPGTFWEYNNVRVNLLSLCLLKVFEKPLPMVYKERVMDPINASDTWQWHGYYNSEVILNNYTSFQPFKSVSGGGQWGGGLWTSTLDLARFGYLYLNDGEWGEDEIFPATWMEASTEPCSEKPVYGYLWWLNTDRLLWPDAPESCIAAIGGGHNVVWLNPEDDLLVVLRWFHGGRVSGRVLDEEYLLADQNDFFARIIDAIEA